MTTLVALPIAAVAQAPPSAATVEATHKQFLDLSEWLRLTSAHSRLEGFELPSVAAGVFGDHAIVRAQAMRKGSVGSRDLSGKFVLVDLWAREKGGWRIRYRVVARPLAPLAD